ncbi:MAG: hypothetical protein A2V98_08215 [Planctomycetes bacterium RBG_16_64_12]|nr:MAG: hypothetical protein A2V98_08215 [Planctomycetes bacterium RBG_16_64_12]
MNDPDPNRQRELDEILLALDKRVRRLTVTVVLLVLAVFLLTAAVFGSLVNYYDGDPMLFGGASVGGVLLGFAFGWFARKRA